MESLDKRVRNLWMTVSTVTGLLFGSVLGVGLYALTEILALVLVPVVVLPALFVAYSYYRYQNWFFEVFDDHLNINYGVISKVSADVPFVRIQHIDTNRGPLERLLGLATLRVYTAGSSGADMGIPGLDRERAEEIQEDLKRKAIESEQGFDGV